MYRAQEGVLYGSVNEVVTCEPGFSEIKRIHPSGQDSDWLTPE